MKKIRELLVALFLVLGVVSLARSQTTTTSTTLSAAVTQSETTLSVASATGFTANTTGMFVDNEYMNVLRVSGTTITVARGMNGTRAQAHTSGELVYVGPLGDGPYIAFQKSGACTSASQLYLPQIHIATGDIYRCTNSEWDREIHASRLKAKLDTTLGLETTSDGRTITLNSRTYETVTTGGSSIGFQTKPAQGVTTTGSIIGAEFSPRINNTFTAANITGIHVDAYLKGTTARTISGNVRALEVEVYTDDAATNTVSGYVTGLRLRSAFSATTITGMFSAIRVEPPETQTNSQTYDGLLELTGTVPLVWNNDPGTEVSGSIKGYIGVYVNATKRYIALYDTAPTD